MSPISEASFLYARVVMLERQLEAARNTACQMEEKAALLKRRGLVDSESAAWLSRPAVAVWPADVDDPMWQFRRRVDGWVEVGGRDGTNWILMRPEDWDEIVEVLSV